MLQSISWTSGTFRTIHCTSAPLQSIEWTSANFEAIQATAVTRINIERESTMLSRIHWIAPTHPLYLRGRPRHPLDLSNGSEHLAGITKGRADSGEFSCASKHQRVLSSVSTHPQDHSNSSRCPSGRNKAEKHPLAVGWPSRELVNDLLAYFIPQVLRFPAEFIARVSISLSPSTLRSEANVD
jgi:hypothetical protein